MSTAADRARALHDRTEQDYAPKWDFNEIPHITGVIESMKQIMFEEGPQIVATLAEPWEGGHRYAVWLSQASLINQFREQRIVEGELVSIRYLGEADHAERGKSPAKRFRVEIDRGSNGNKFDWDAAGERRPTQPGQPSATTDAPELSEEEHAAAMATYDAPPHGDDDIPFA